MSTLIPFSTLDALIAEHPRLAPSTKQQYQKAVAGALAAGVNLADAEALGAYAAELNKSSRSFLRAAVKLWAEKLADQARAGATPQNVNTVTATIYRAQALTKAIEVKPGKGQKAHIWLTRTEVARLQATCNPRTVRGRRDKIILGLLAGAGLRRGELAGLRFGDIILQPVAGRFRTVLNIKGKGARDRIIPIKDELAAGLDDWGNSLKHTGPVARSVTKGDAIGASISAVGIFKIVARAGAKMGKPELAAHDLRRTYAQLAHEAGVSIAQICRLLGHASIATTQRYLNLELDLEVTASDFVPFKWGE